ncbi:MAG TPA: hypothetical protein VI462_09145 [Acidimicrobiia bacterium]
MTLDELLARYRQTWYLPDPGPIEVVLAAVVANQLPGTPAWVLLVGPPGSGKTEALRLLDPDALPKGDPHRWALANVHFASTFTEPGLLSASSTRTASATGGLLVKLGAQGIIVFKDLTTMLGKVGGRDRSALDLLREVHDGSFVRNTGTQGGKTFAWRGKAGALGAVTEEIDRHHNAVAAMGPRFLYYRMPRLDADERLAQGRAVLGAVGREEQVRAELTHTAARLLTSLNIPSQAPGLDSETRERLLLAADIAAQARSAVSRDGATGQIEAIDDPEATSRMLATLDLMHGALAVVTGDPAEAWRVTAKLTWDSIPKARRLVLDALWAQPGLLPRTGLIADAIGLPTGPTHRALEDLAAHQLVERCSKDHGEHQWRLAERIRHRLDQVGYEPLRTQPARASAERPVV